jgi:hypothetical protein
MKFIFAQNRKARQERLEDKKWLAFLGASAPLRENGFAFLSGGINRDNVNQTHHTLS